MPISEKWFCEGTVPGERLGKLKHCFLIDKLIFQGKTPFQKVLVFNNLLYGRVFCLNNVIQLTEQDEFIYHEMLTHPILFSHSNPKNILIIGGGDGGVLREVLKHKVSQVDLVEIDKEIIEISKKYLRFVCQDSFSDKRVRIFNLSGEKFIKRAKNFYDIVIIDSTNPFQENIAFPLYSLNFYKNIFNSLRRDGIMITLGASFLDFDNIIKGTFKKLKKVFPLVSIFRFCMPSYHCGEYCFLGASKKIDLTKVDFKRIERRFKKIQKKYKFRYYSPEIHKAALILPKKFKLN